ncbi:MAG: hypothetical protein IKC94_02920 [Lentisphaeria bacterium]|nr:hypothetical protein [Lentisphaeria bacterium]
MKKSFALLTAMCLTAGAFAGETLNIPATDPVQEITLTPVNHRHWKKLSFNSRNLLYSSTSITLNSQIAGPILRHALTVKPQFIVIDLVYSGTDENCPGPQQQTLITLNGPDGKGILWGLRFGRDSVRFLDEKPVTFTLPDDGKTAVRILIDTASQIAEVYINGGTVPVLRHKAFKLNAPASEPSVSIGDGSVAVKGVCELYRMDIKLY